MFELRVFWLDRLVKGRRQLKKTIEEKEGIDLLQAEIKNWLSTFSASQKQILLPRCTLCVTTDEYTTGWQRLEIGTMAGCTISPVAFTMAMEVIIQASQ